MKKIQKLDLPVIETVLDDLMQSENDLFNQYDGYDVFNVNRIENIVKYEAKISFDDIDDHEEKDLFIFEYPNGKLEYEMRETDE